MFRLEMERQQRSKSNHTWNSRKRNYRYYQWNDPVPKGQREGLRKWANRPREHNFLTSTSKFICQHAMMVFLYPLFISFLMRGQNNRSFTWYNVLYSPIWPTADKAFISINIMRRRDEGTIMWHIFFIETVTGSR